jgi:hypothetical protein
MEPNIAKEMLELLSIVWREVQQTKEVNSAQFDLFHARLDHHGLLIAGLDEISPEIADAITGFQVSIKEQLDRLNARNVSGEDQLDAMFLRLQELIKGMAD